MDVSHHDGTGEIVCARGASEWSSSAEMAVSCSPGDASISASGYAKDGRIGFATHAALGVRADETSGGVFSSGWAEWNDHLTWRAPSDYVTVMFEVAVHGNLYANYEGTFGSQASGVTWTNFSLAAADLSPSPSNTSFGKYDHVSPHTLGSPGHRASYLHEENVFLRYLFTVVPGQTGTDISLFLQSYAAAGASSDGGTATAGTNFLNTAKLTDLQFIDAQGTNITSGMNYSFANGTQIYPASATVTPEPISMALLGTGLAGLAALRWTRRRKEEESA